MSEATSVVSAKLAAKQPADYSAQLPPVTESVSREVSAKGTDRVHAFNRLLSTYRLDSQTTTPISSMEPFLHSLYNSYNESNSVEYGASSAEDTNTTPATFVRSILEPARSAARLLGTSAEVIIAFAALETGWGKHIIEKPDGTSSHNLFGIKTHRSQQPQIDSVIAKTTEYIDNTVVTMDQPFRSYTSRSDSVADFARFLQDNPRYQTALEYSHDGSKFIELVHQAGYATDPNYASKVRSLVTKVADIASSLDIPESVVPLIDLGITDQ